MKYLVIEPEGHDALRRYYTLQELQEFIVECVNAGAPRDAQIRLDTPRVTIPLDGPSE